MNEAARNLCIQVFWGHQLSFLLGKYLGVKLLAFLMIVCWRWNQRRWRRGQVLRGPGALPSSDNTHLVGSRGCPSTVSQGRFSSLIFSHQQRAFPYACEWQGFLCPSHSGLKLLIFMRGWSGQGDWGSCFPHSSHCSPSAGLYHLGGLSGYSPGHHLGHEHLLESMEKSPVVSTDCSCLRLPGISLGTTHTPSLPVL